MKSFLRLVLCVLACALPASAALNRCIGGNATGSFPIGEGFALEISAGAGEHAGTCRGTVRGAGGVVLDVYSYELTVDEFSGKDVNNDGQPDLILVGRIGKGDPLTYWIVSFSAPPMVARQITTVYPLSFEDRDGDGKLEIWTREWAYDGIDGLSPEDSPHPLVAFRLVGSRLLWACPQFGEEYEREVIQAQQRITKEAVDHLKNQDTGGGGVNAAREGEKPKQDPKLDARAQEAKLGILSVVTSYLYAGKAAEAWKALGDWPYNDRMRIQQAILRARQNGIMKQLTAPQPAQSKQAAAPAPVAAQPQ